MSLRFDSSKQYAAFLFDMDGTILSSTASAERVWGRWAARHGLDVEKFLPTMHGSRGIDTIRRLNLPGVDAEAEAAEITEEEIRDVEGVVALPGAADFLASLPPNRWTIVTSSPRRLAERRLEAAGLPLPQAIVTAEDVTIGKPDPQCYILGAEKLGFATHECLVFEDVEAGVKAGTAAGADVMLITAAGHKHSLQGYPEIEHYAGATVVIADSGHLSIKF